MKRLLSATTIAVVAALTLAGCGSTSTSSSAGTFNDADVTFARSMIPHHQQAVQMAQMAKTHASTTEVKQLADTIEAAQGPEIATMTGWLKAWGKPLPSGSDMSGHDMGSMSGDMPGMMSDGEMKKLDVATGAEFDQMFLTMMIKHHTGAIEMAKTEQSDGKNPDAV
ncbi:MAG: DUF305 domain-containing protein, partial [Nocardioidaceae bacterium]|nr:DUF305 domain-containing protein [Nocardioidaceae bacterium]